MATLRSSIELQDNFSAVMANIISVANMGISTMYDMADAMNTDVDAPVVDTSGLDTARQAMAAAELQMRELSGAAQDISQPDFSAWQSNNFEVFSTSGIERFRSEVQSASLMLNTLNSTQNKITQAAAGMDIFPDSAVADLGNMQVRIQAVQQRIEQISNNKVNLGTAEANSELERMRTQLDSMLDIQTELNSAVDRMDYDAANRYAMQLSGNLTSMEQYVRDAADEQGRFNNLIEQGNTSAGGLLGTIKSMAGAFLGIAGIRKAISFAQDSMDAFDTQINAQNQLGAVLANTIGSMEMGVDISGAEAALESINGLMDTGVAEIIVTANTNAVSEAYDAILAKASEIQSQGIYGDEAMIAGAAELSTYISDVDAITRMMDTLSDYAMGMSGGGELDATVMTDYATNLGKIMSGSYDAMTKKGFEFTDAQKAIIDGTATQAQLVSVLGSGYESMSEDMQKVAVIEQVIGESWDGLYGTMSNTPEGQIIQLTNRFGDLQEMVGGRIYNAWLQFVDMLSGNWGTIESVVNGITTAIMGAIYVITEIADIAMQAASVIIDNLSWIAPIVMGIVTALGLYHGAMLAYNTITGIASGIAAIHAAMTGAQAAATGVATGAQAAFNAALWACPITWIVAGVLAIIVVLYAAVGAYNDLTDSSVSATGIITGVLASAAAFIGNLFVGLANYAIGIGVTVYNTFSNFAAAFGVLFNDPVAAIEATMLSMFNFIVGIAKSAASILDAVFGSNLADAVAGFQNTIQAKIDTTIEDAGGTAANQLDASDYQLERFNYGEAWSSGYEFGSDLESSVTDKLSSMFGAGQGLTTDWSDYVSDGITDSGLSSASGDTAANTGAIADSLSATEEELKYLRDIAEREAVNRYTTAEIIIDQSGMNNTVASSTNLDDIINHLADGVAEAILEVTEGVHV